MQNPKMIKVETDSSGLMKAVIFEDKSLPVTEISMYADAGSPLITAELTMPAQADLTAQVGQVSLFCPVCETTHTHICYDSPSDDNSQDPEY